MPLDPSEFPVEVQVAFFVFELLEDRWEGMSGSYMGKDWGSVEYLFKLYSIQDQKTVYYLMKLWEGVLVEYRATKADRKRKADERKSASGGKNFTHNVKG